MLRATVSTFAVVVLSAIAVGSGQAGEKDGSLKALLKELDALRAEVRELRTEVRELRAEMRDLRKSSAPATPGKTTGKAPANKLLAALIGEWKTEGGGETYIFTDKGVYVHKTAGSLGVQIRGKYRLTDEDKLELTPTEGAPFGLKLARMCRIEIEDDMLTLYQSAPIATTAIQLFRQKKR